MTTRDGVYVHIEEKESQLKVVTDAMHSLRIRIQNLSKFIDSLEGTKSLSEVPGIHIDDKKEEILLFGEVWRGIPSSLLELERFLAEQIQRLEQIIK